VGSYNGLVRQKAEVENRWNEVDNQLQRRNDLISNLVETVKGAAGQEQAVFGEIAAARAADGLAVRNGQRSYVTPGQVFPTSHWHGAVVSEQRVLNTLTGLVNEVRIEARGREPVETERGMVAAGRYAYSGDLNTDVWYDDCGRWVKLRFQARDGSTIDYVCRRCQGGVATRAGL